MEKDKKIQNYNFKRPDRISKNQIRSLHFVHDRFARNASSSISAYLRMVVEISLEGRSVRGPIKIAPGHPAQTITAYLGFGRTGIAGEGYSAYQIRTSGSLWSAGGAALRDESTNDRGALLLARLRER